MHWCIFVFEDICFLIHWIIILCNVSINVLDSDSAFSACHLSGLLVSSCCRFVLTLDKDILILSNYHIFDWFVLWIGGERYVLCLHVVPCVIILLLRRVLKLFLNIKIIISLRYCFECCVIFSIFANVLRKVVFCFLLNTIGQDANCNKSITLRHALLWIFINF